MRSFVLTLMFFAYGFSSGPAVSRPPIELNYANGDVSLAAELWLPEAAKRAPAVVIVHGSGPADRSNTWVRAVAKAFLERDVAVLLTDKRGSGKSSGDWRNAGFDELAGDALAGVSALENHPEVDGGRIGLVGLSQGGRIVPLAAARSRKVAFVINIVGDAVTFPEQSFAEMANTVRQAGLGPESVAEIIELNAAGGRYILSGDWHEYERLRNKALKGPAAKIAAGFPGSKDAPIWMFLRKVSAYDPLPYWSVITQPSLIVYGQEDEKDNVPVSESVRRLEHAFSLAQKKNSEIVVLPALGHDLWSTQHNGLAPSFLAALSDWLKTNLR